MGVFALNYHRMILREPGPGGAVRFARKVFGEDHGFLVGWFLIACGWLCMSDKRLVAKLQIGLAFILAVSVAVFFAVAVFRHQGGVSAMGPAFSPLSGSSPFMQFMQIFAMMPWAFVGAAMLAGQLTGIFGAYVATSRLMYCLARNDAMPT